MFVLINLNLISSSVIKKFLLFVKVRKSFKHCLNSLMKNKHNSFDELKGKFIFVDFKYLNKLSKTLFIIFG